MTLSPDIAAQLWRVSPAAMARHLSRWEPYRFETPQHILLVSDAICDAVAGRMPRLIITLPPRHGKSELVSKWLPTWYLNAWPSKHVMLCGYGADFAATWGRAVRNKAKYHEDRLALRLADDSKAAGRWNTSDGGGMVATGVGGDITGRGADCLIVDDPVKNWQEANSLVYRDMVWDWWQTTARTRLHPGGAIVVCMTRWHSDDLVGRLLAKAQSDPASDQWRVINLPAEAESGDPLGRLPGQPLWPERYGATDLAQIKASVGIEAWESLYQQHPLDLVAHGNVYRSFAADNVEPCPFDPRLPVCWSLDFNVDPMCSVLAQIQEHGSWIATLTGRTERTLRVLREISLADATTIDACQEFLSLTAPWLDECRRHRSTLRVRIYGDRSGQSRKTSGTTDYELIRQFFRGRAGYSVTFHLQKANPAVRDRVNAVNAMLCDASGTRRMYVDPACEKLRLDLQRVKWKRDSSNNVTGQIDKSDQSLTHVSDALGYLVEREFGLKSVAGGRPGILQ